MLVIVITEAQHACASRPFCRADKPLLSPSPFTLCPGAGVLKPLALAQRYGFRWWPWSPGFDVFQSFHGAPWIENHHPRGTAPLFQPRSSCPRMDPRTRDPESPGTGSICSSEARRLVLGQRGWRGRNQRLPQHRNRWPCAVHAGAAPSVSSVSSQNSRRLVSPLQGTALGRRWGSSNPHVSLNPEKEAVRKCPLR